MKTIYTLIIAAFTLAACNENPEPIDIPEPTTYNVEVIIECDSCQGGIEVSNDIVFFGDVINLKQFDTVLNAGNTITLSAVDYFPDNAIYYTKILVDGVLMADSLAIGDTTQSIIICHCNYTLK